jgi:hypothetical protein
MHFWKIPAEWQGATVRLIAEDNATGDSDWMGITAPKAGGESLLFSVFRAGYRSAVLLFLALLFLTPGLALALWASRKLTIDFFQSIAIVLCGSGVAGYATFWAFFANTSLGKNFSLLILGGSVLFIVWNRRRTALLPAWRETMACLGMALALGVFYSALGFLYPTDDGIGEQPQVRYNIGFMPPDNVLPYLMAERLYEAKSTKPPLIAFWKGSDRPPLQTGAVLLVFKAARGLGTLSLLYQLVSTFLQCLGVVGVWVLVRAAGLDKRYLVPILAFVILSEVASFHTFYVWPKMLAAAYVLVAMAPVFRGKWTMLDAVLSSVCTALGVLAHTGALFTLLPFALLVLILRRLPSWKMLGAGLAAALVLMIPWRWYQTVYDPPGDYLLKFNMTNAQDEAAIQKPFGQLLKESYANMSAGAFFQSKWEDAKTLFYGGELAGLESIEPGKVLASLETGTFFHLFLSLGVVNLGFLCRFLLTKSASGSPAVRFADQCLWMIAASLLLWMLVLYPPGATIIHQWSLANMLILYVILTIYIIEGRPQLLIPLLALQMLCIFPLLILAKPLVEAVPGAVFDAPFDFGMGLIALVAGSGIVYGGWRVKLQEAS